MTDDDYRTNDDNTTNDDFQAQPGDTNPMADMSENGKLEEDNDPPFSPPTGVQDRIGDTHQVTDTNIDAHERYDAGIEGAASVDLPGEPADDEGGSDLPEELIDRNAA